MTTDLTTTAPYTQNKVSVTFSDTEQQLQRIAAHTFRHSFATRKIKETAKNQAVSAYQGHSSVAIILSLYCHDELSEEDLSSETDMIGIAA